MSAYDLLPMAVAMGYMTSPASRAGLFNELVPQGGGLYFEDDTLIFFARYSGPAARDRRY